MNKVGMSAAAMGIAVAAATAGAAAPASAGQVKTHVTVSPGGPFTLTSPGSVSQIVTVGLDSNCLQAFGNANQTFGIAAATDNAGVVTVSPNSWPGLHCGETHDFTITGLSDGGGTITFDAVANKGLEGQTAGKSVNVTVTGFGTPTPTPNPDGHNKPAPPAVANAHVPHGSALADTCKAHYNGAKSWHGLLIRDIAKWAQQQKLNQNKDSYTDDAWVALITGQVDSICNAPPTG